MKTIERRVNKRASSKDTVTTLGCAGIGIIGSAVATLEKRGEYYGSHPQAGDHIDLKLTGTVTIPIGTSGDSLTFTNNTRGDVVIFPNAIATEFASCNPAIPGSTPVVLSDAVGFTNSGPLFGSENLDRGGYGLTRTDRINGKVVDQDVQLAVGGFEELKRLQGERYPLNLPQGTIWVSPLTDLNGTFVHEVKGHVCSDTSGENVGQRAQYYFLTGSSPVLIVPESLKPNFLYPEIILTAIALTTIARLALGKIIHKKARKKQKKIVKK